MLNLFRRQKKETPTWRQWYAIPTREAKAPEWVQYLQKENKGIQGDFHVRAEAPEWIFDEHTFGGDGMGPTLAGARGVASIRVVCQADRKLFVSMADFACRFSQRELGIVAIVPAMRMHRAAAWLPKLREFRPLDHYTVHQVHSGDSPLWVHTHGLIQFGLPEIEIREVPRELEDAAGSFITVMREWMMQGEQIGAGHTIELPGHPRIWTIAESISAVDNEDHGEPLYPLLRFCDYDPLTRQRGTGLTRYLTALRDERR